MIMKCVHHKLTCLNSWSVAGPRVAGPNALGGYEAFRRWDLPGRGGSPRAGSEVLQTSCISSLMSTSESIKMRRASTVAVHHPGTKPHQAFQTLIGWWPLKP